MKNKKRKCKFTKELIGCCSNDAETFSEYCEEHIGTQCIMCRCEATHDCAETFGGLFCGQPLCDDEKCHKKHMKEYHDNV